jgi:hypothetical protein
MKGTKLSFVVLKPKEQVEKQGLNQTRTSCASNVVMGYGPYLKSQMSKSYFIISFEHPKWYSVMANECFALMHN